MAHNSLPWAHSAKDKVMFPELEGWEDYTYGMANQAELKKRINKANSVSTFPAFKSIAEEQGMSATALIAMERKAAESPDTQLIYNGFQINGGHWEQLDDLCLTYRI